MIDWSEVEDTKIGRVAEHIAETFFLSNGFDVYSTDSDDKWIDFIAVYHDVNYNIQVKSCRDDNYQYVRDSKFNKVNNYFVFFVRFTENEIPELYMFKGDEWEEKKPLLVVRNYNENQKSEPEHGINVGSQIKEAKILAESDAQKWVDEVKNQYA